MKDNRQKVINKLQGKDYTEMFKDLLEELWASAEFGLYESTTQDELVARLKDKYFYYSRMLSNKHYEELNERLKSRGL